MPVLLLPPLRFPRAAVFVAMKSSSRCLRLIGSAIMLSSTGVLATQSADRSPNSVLDSVGSSDSMLGSYSFTTDDDGCRPGDTVRLLCTKHSVRRIAAELCTQQRLKLLSPMQERNGYQEAIEQGTGVAGVTYSGCQGPSPERC